jgi:hypothetical protein
VPGSDLEPIGSLAGMLRPWYAHGTQRNESFREKDMKPRPNHQVYIAALRAMSSEARLRKAFELSSLARELLMTGLRRRHPEMSETELHQLFLSRLQKSWDRPE